MSEGMPKPTCRHGESAYADLDTGTLDDSHIFCAVCGAVVCLNVTDPYKKAGKCTTCGTIMSETYKKQDDGVGTIRWEAWYRDGRRCAE